jgi:hypothetical protein
LVVKNVQRDIFSIDQVPYEEDMTTGRSNSLYSNFKPYEQSMTDRPAELPIVTLNKWAQDSNPTKFAEFPIVTLNLMSMV